MLGYLESLAEEQHNILKDTCSAMNDMEIFITERQTGKKSRLTFEMSEDFDTLGAELLLKENRS